MQSKATTVAKYLAELPEDRRQALEAVRKVIRANLDPELREGMQYGMIGYYVPHERYPAGYHCDPKQPLPFAGLASQKNHMALYMMCQYAEGEDNDAFRAAWAKTGKKLDMGKSCIRFKRVEDLAVDVIGDVIRNMPVDRFIAFYEAAIKPQAKSKPTAKPKPTAKAKKKPPAAKASGKPAAAKKRGS